MSATQKLSVRPHACARDGAYSRLSHLFNVHVPSRLGFVAALAYETGMSLSDMCELKLTNFDLLRRRVAVHDADGVHDWLYTFGNETLIFLGMWLQDRDAGVDDGIFGRLLHDDNVAPCTLAGLVAEFTRVLAPAYAAWDDHPDGHICFDVGDLYA